MHFSLKTNIIFSSFSKKKKNPNEFTLRIFKPFMAVHMKTLKRKKVLAIFIESLVYCVVVLSHGYSNLGIIVCLLLNYLSVQELNLRGLAW